MTYKHLLDNFIPKKYSIHASIARGGSYSIETITTIEGTTKDASKILLHSKNLSINSVKIKDEACTFELIEQNDELSIDISSLNIPVDSKISIIINSTCRIDNSMTGVYFSSFKDKGREKRIVTTQFESHHAREFIPCIDEPSAKAVFELTVSDDSAFEFISNTEIASKEIVGSTTTVRFKETPVMSTYLLGFTVGELAYVSSKGKVSDTITRIWSTPNNVDYLDFSLDVATRALDFFEEYFGIEFPLEVCNHIALPDFSHGAMENWGMITYRESGLIVNNKTPLQFKKHVAMVIIHELTHQWFGNLVTMKWWNDLWLNEGFASFMPYIVMDDFFPEWNVWDDFVSDEMLSVQTSDATLNTHPIEVEIKHPDEIRSIFDEISYEKGCTVVRMMYELVGVTHFKEAMNLYLSRHAYSNATTNDLWNAMGEASGKDVASFMNAWTSQSGFPAVNIKDSTLCQERFFLLAPEKPDQTTWPIPIGDTIITDSSKNLKKLPKNLNPKAINMFVTYYSDEQFAKKLAEDLSDAEIAQLISDIDLAVKAGRAPISRYFRIIETFKESNSVAVWQEITALISSSAKILINEEDKKLLRAYVNHISDRLISSLGYTKNTDEEQGVTELRTIAIGLRSFGRSESTLRNFREIQSSGNIDPDHQSIILSAMARNSNADFYQQLLSTYKTSDSAQEQRAVARALCAFEDSTSIEKNLQLLKSDTVRLQDLISWLAGLCMNNKARDQAWQWLQANWEWVSDNYANDISTMRYFPLILRSNFYEQAELDSFRSFFEDKKMHGFERAIAQAEETIQWHINYKQTSQEKLLEALKIQLNKL